jgi:hypothetical protein
MKNSNSENTLLYISGNHDIDNLIEEQFPGEDVFVSFERDDSKLILSIDDYQICLEFKNISQIKMEYESGLYLFYYKTEECVFSFDRRISYELLSFFFQLNVKVEIPEFIHSRYRQMQDTALLNLINKERDFIATNDYFHYYEDIDEYGYSAIVESFARQALNELPLFYIKYFNAGEKENGFLVTYNSIYSPENFISISEIKSVSYKIDNGIFDSVQCLINNKLFATFPIVLDASPVPGAYRGYSLMVLVEGIESLVNKICIYRKTGKL